MTLLVLLAACAGKADDTSSADETGSAGDTGDTDPAPSGDVWAAAPGTSWQIQYSGRLDVSLDVDMYDLDLFDTPDAIVSDVTTTHALVCYFSAGSYEDWRPDASDFPQGALGDPLDGWPGEWWLDIRNDAVRAIMEARMDLAVERGCDGVDPDNVNGWENPTGLSLTKADQLDYNRFLAEAAHARGLSVALKNDQGQLPDLADWFDYAVNEECAAYEECGDYAAFTAAGKAVFHIEYVDDWADAAAKADEVCGVGPSLDTLVKTWDLGAEFQDCSGR